MSGHLTTPSLADLAHTVRDGIESVNETMRNALRIAFTVGEALIAARQQVEPGYWGQWLKTNCSLSRRTAEVYVQLAQHRCELEQHIAEFPNLSLRAARKLITKPLKATTQKKAPPRRGY
jgi:hypothetical protein